MGSELEENVDQARSRRNERGRIRHVVGHSYLRTLEFPLKMKDVLSRIVI